MKVKLLFPMLLTGMAFFFNACSSDEDELKEFEPYSVSNVDTVWLNRDQHMATADNPAVVTATSPVAIQMSLPSTYTDPDGTIFRAEPETSIQASIDADTVRVANIAQLMGIYSRKSDGEMYEKDGMLIHDQDLVFAMGGQNIHIKYYSEQIAHHNSEGMEVSIPYLHLEGTGVKFGQPTAIEIPPVAAAESDEISPSDAAHIKAIRLKPINQPQTRDGLTAEQAYDVSVIFTVDFLTGTLAVQPFTLYCKVKFVGIVEATDDESQT